MVINYHESSDDNTPQSQYLKGVKQLYENGLHSVPNKYILPASDRPNTNKEEPHVASSNSIQLPIIDFTELQGPNRPQVLRSLSNACENYGFFQVGINGISLLADLE